MKIKHLLGLWTLKSVWENRNQQKASGELIKIEDEDSV